jgi:hypothetical protein
MTYPSDFNTDATDLIWRSLETNNVGCRDRLKQSVDTAAAHLELAKLGLMATPGIAPFVLAHHEKVLSFCLRPAEGHTFTECVTHIVDCTKKVAGDNANKLASGVSLCRMVTYVIEEHGWIPGRDETTADIEDEKNTRIVGMLLLPMPNASRQIASFQSAINAGICPVWVGLLGDDPQTGLCMAWPLLIPLAPYASATNNQLH